MLLRQVQFANLMNVTSRTVRGWIAAGMPTSPAGIDPDVARRWLAEHIDRDRAGWGVRKPIAEGAAPSSSPGRLTYLAGGCAALNAARGTGAVEFMTETALALGCTPMQATSIGVQFDLLVAGFLADVWAGGRDVIQRHRDPDYAWLAELSGEKFDPAACLREGNKLIEAWARKEHGFTGRPKEGAPK